MWTSILRGFACAGLLSLVPGCVYPSDALDCSTPGGFQLEIAAPDVAARLRVASTASETGLTLDSVMLWVNRGAGHCRVSAYFGDAVASDDLQATTPDSSAAPVYPGAVLVADTVLPAAVPEVVIHERVQAELPIVPDVAFSRELTVVACEDAAVGVEGTVIVQWHDVDGRCPSIVDLEVLP